MKRLFVLILGLMPSIASALPLDTIGTFCGTFPDQCRKGTMSLMTIRGTGTNAYYVMEVDPTTGAIPTTATVTLTSQGTPGAANPATALQVAGTDGTLLRTLLTDTTGRLKLAGRTYADSVRLDYSGTSVTTGAWVQLIASTASASTCVTLFDSSGRTLELGTGAAASETRVLIIPPGGLDGCIPLAIASGSRVSVRAVSATASSGELDLTELL